MPPIEQRLSLSTCWCSHRHRDGYTMLSEIRELGFHRVELSHGIRMSLVPGIVEGVEDGVVEISSLHNFCPLPCSVQHAAPNYYEPSARSSAERAFWKRYTEQTIDFAERLGTQAIVMHSGSFQSRMRLPDSPPGEEGAPESLWEKPLKQMRKKGGQNSRRFQRIVSAYREVLPLASSKDITLCAENREGALELPLDDDFLPFLTQIADLSSPTSETGGNYIRYWHDTGHARLKEILGLIDHRKHLESISEKIAGFHLHDVSHDGHDHQIPGTGTVDFEMVREFVKEDHIVVAELSPKLTKYDLLKSRDFLLSLLQ